MKGRLEEGRSPMTLEGLGTARIPEVRGGVWESERRPPQADLETSEPSGVSGQTGHGDKGAQS